MPLNEYPDAGMENIAGEYSPTDGGCAVSTDAAEYPTGTTHFRFSTLDALYGFEAILNPIGGTGSTCGGSVKYPTTGVACFMVEAWDMGQTPHVRLGRKVFVAT